MTKLDTEEKSPLLFVVDEDVPLRSGYFEGRRFNNVATGATAVFTHFPNYIGTCWIATAISALVFFMMILLVLSTITAASLRVPRCVAAELPNNQTIHLVHVHHSHKPEHDKVKFIQKIMTLYPMYSIRILNIIDEKKHINEVSSTEFDFFKETLNKNEVIPESTLTTIKRQKILKRRESIEDAQMLLNMLLHAKLVERTEPKRLTTSLKKVTEITKMTTPKPLKTIEDLILANPNITYEKLTYKKAFAESPLSTHYTLMNDKLKIFAVRVLQIWQYGGMSFDLETKHKNLKDLTSNNLNDHPSFILTEMEFNHLTDVVIVDEKALHLESKVACHALFGQILNLLRQSNAYTTTKDIMKKTITGFCKHYVPNLEYCKKYVTV